MQKPDEGVGLCARCRHGRRVPATRAVYWLCGRSHDDPRYAKYPRLPVLACPGFEPEAAVDPEGTAGV